MSAETVTYVASSGYTWVAVACGAIVVAIVGVIVVVDRRQKRSMDPTDETVGVAGPWYRVFMGRFRARARFVLSLDLDGAGPEGEVVADAAEPTTDLRVSVGVTNASKADAGRTTMTVLVPRGCEARWVGAGATGEAEPATELLGTGADRVQSSALTQVLPEVGPGDSPVATLTVRVPVPAATVGRIRIPMRFRAVSDALGVGEDPVIDRVFTVRPS